MIGKCFGTLRIFAILILEWVITKDFNSFGTLRIFAILILESEANGNK